MDYSITQDDGRLTAHRTDCPEVQAQREAERPIMTLFGCDGALPMDVKVCHCLRDSAKMDHAQ